MDPSLIMMDSASATTAADSAPVVPSPAPVVTPLMATARPKRNARKKTKQFLSDDDDDEFIYTNDDLPPTKLKLKIGATGGGAGAGSSHRSHHHHQHHGAGHATNGTSAGGGGGSGEIGPAGIDTSGIGWDRELDSDADEPLAVEEQFILRVPPALAPKLREQVEARNVGPDVSFKFKDSRRAVFTMGGKMYGAKLVDLPTLLESQKLTGSGGNSVKVADISQMLLVEDEVKDEHEITKDKPFNIEDFVYPHGITPPLKHVRKRRFRKRINKRTIEIVENAVEQLLQRDSMAEQVQYELLDHDVPSDDEYDNLGGGGESGRNGHQPGGAPDHSSLGAPTPRRDGSPFSAQGDYDGAAGHDYAEDQEDDFGGDADRDGDGEGEGSGYDSDLANEINKGMAALEASASEDEDEDDSDAGGLFGGSSDDDEEEEEEQAVDPETAEMRKKVKLLLEETGDLERAIQSKETELSKAANPIFKKRFEEMIKKLSVERDVKRGQHAKAVAELEKRQAAGRAAQDAAVAETTAASNAAAAAGPGANSAPAFVATVGADSGTSGPVGSGNPSEDRMDTT